MPLAFGLQGVTPSLRGLPTNALTLQPGETQLVAAGAWNISCDGYSQVQQFDPVSGVWYEIGGSSYGGIGVSPGMVRYTNSDGVNWRIANQTGCVVGAVVTTAGTGYTQSTLPTCSAASGGAVFNVIGGQYVTSVTVNAAGTSYTYPPQILFDAPPAGAGVQATAYATLSSSTLSSITMTNAGAGYTNVPAVYIIPDPRDTTGVGARATAVLAGSGGVLAVLVTNHGTTLTARPALTFSAGSAAGTAVMCFSITAFTVNSAGSGYSGGIEVSALGSGLAGVTAVLTNPRVETALVSTRRASILVTAGATISATGQTVLDGGIYAGTNPTQIIFGGFTGSVGNVAFTWGGFNSSVLMLAA